MRLLLKCPEQNKTKLGKLIDDNHRLLAFAVFDMLFAQKRFLVAMYLYVFQRHNMLSRGSRDVIMLSLTLC